MISPERQRLYGSCFVAADHPELLSEASELVTRMVLEACPLMCAARETRLDIEGARD